jgi:hypothetical protein
VWISSGAFHCQCVRDPPPPLRTPPKGKEGGERERERKRRERECDQYVGKTETRVVCSCCIVVSTAAVLSYPTRFAASSKGKPGSLFFSAETAGPLPNNTLPIYPQRRPFFLVFPFLRLHTSSQEPGAARLDIISCVCVSSLSVCLCGYYKIISETKRRKEKEKTDRWKRKEETE